MDARGQALTPAGAARRALGSALVSLLVGIAGARVAADPGLASLDLHEQHGDDVLDAETLAELDDLLRDPVDLNRGDLERLRWLPWLDTAAIESVRAARPLADRDALARLPGWTEERLRLSMPFVQVSPAAAEAPWRAEVASRALRARTELLARASTSHASVELRRTSDPLLPAAGYASARLGGLRLLAGDLKANHAQGLLWASGPQVLRSGATPLRHGRGFTGTTGLDRARVVRGGALEARAGRFGFEIAAGTHATAQLGAGAVQVHVGAARLRAAAMRRGERAWVATEIRREHGKSGAALEVVYGGGDFAWALAARAAQRGLQLAARVEQAAIDASPFAATRPRTRAGLAEARWRHAGVTVLATVAATAGTDTLGADEREVDRALEARWTGAAIGVEGRWNERRERTRRLGPEAPEPDADRVLRRLMARLRWQRRHTRGWLEHRSVELMRSDAATESGSSWQLGVEADRHAWRATLACTAFRVTHGHAAPVVPEPGLGGGGAWRLYGDGVRVAAGLRLDRAHAACLVRAAWQVTAPREHTVLVEAALHLRKP